MCLKEFESQIIFHKKKETGGILLGKLIEDTIIVFKVSGPGPNAIHEPLFFRADKNYIDMIIDLEYANSDGEVVYLGEWHTHPQVIPFPSELDLSSLNEITYSAGSPKILLILGAIGFNLENIRSQSLVLLKYPRKESFIRFTFELA